MMGEPRNVRTFDGKIALRNFPKFGVWRVVGFDLVAPNRLQPREPAIRCVLHPVSGVSTRWTKWYAWLPVGWLPYVSIGTLWEHRECVGDALDPTDPEQIFDNSITISDDQTSDLGIVQKHIRKIDSAGNPIDQKNYVTPPFKYSFFGLDGEGCRLVGVKNGNDPYALIVPAIVLIQFYMATTTRLSQALFTGRFSTLYDRSSARFVDRPGGTYRIRLQGDLAIDDAAVVARFTAAPRASAERKAIVRAHASLVRARVNAQPSCPSALFPFTGKTRLKALGVWMDGDPAFGVPTPRRFLVHRLLECSGGFPFEALEVEQLVPEGPDEEQDSGKPRVVVSKLSGAMTLVDDIKAASEKAPVTVPTETVAKRFTALNDIAIRTIAVPKPRLGAGQAIFAPAAPSDPGSTGPSTAEGTGVHPVKMEHRPEKRTDWEREQTPPPPEPLDRSACARGVAAFVDLLQSLRETPAVEEVLTKPLSGKVVEVSGWQFGFIPKGHGHTWQLRDVNGAPRKTQRARLLLLASLRVGGIHCYLLDLEPQDDEATGPMMLIARASGGPVLAQTLAAIIDVVRDHRGTFSDDKISEKLRNHINRSLGAWEDLKFIGISHNRSKVADYVDRILSEAVAIAANRTSAASPNQAAD